MSRTRRSRVRGVSLFEAVVALAVMGFGMLGVAAMQTSLRHNADVARQRAEAVRLASQSLEQARAYSIVNTDPAGVKRAYADIVAGAASTAASSNAVFTRTVSVNESVAWRGKTVQVRVTWQDRTDAAQEVLLATQIHRVPPEVAASLIIPGNNTATQTPLQRNPTIPFGAIPIGGGKSEFTPPGGGGVTWIFDNSTGLIERRCSPGCTTLFARLLAGYITFAVDPATAPTSSASENPFSAALPVTLSIAQTAPVGASAGECFYENLPTLPSGGGVVAYYCMVRVLASSGTQSLWSGRSTVQGLTLATAVTDPSLGAMKVCRYTAYRNNNAVGTGVPQITNQDHPLDYELVNSNLINQNFLVIAAGSGTTAYTCPDDDPATVTANGRTWHHQPPS